MHNKQDSYEERYEYENEITTCPNCGTKLSVKDKQCPSCLINLVGYSEENNRIKNINNSADEIMRIAKEKRKLSEKHNDNSEKKKKAQQIVCTVIGLIAVIIVFVLIFPSLKNGYQEAGHIGNYQTHKEVVESFLKTTEEYNEKIGPFNFEFGQKISSKGNLEDLYLGGNTTGYSQGLYENGEDTKTTFIHSYSDGSLLHEFRFDFDNKIVYAPEVTIMRENISFEGKTLSGFEYEFNRLYQDDLNEKLSLADNFVVGKYVNDKNNLIKKYGKLNIILPRNTMLADENQKIKDVLIFDIYIRENTKNTYTPHELILVSELSDNTVYSIKISVPNKEMIYMMLDEPDKYFSMSYNCTSIEMLD